MAAREYEGYEWEKKLLPTGRKIFITKPPVQEQVSFHYEPSGMQYSSLYEYFAVSAQYYDHFR